MKIKRSYRYLTEAAKRNSIPEPYSKYYEIDTEGEKDFPDMLGEVIDGYGCKILHYLIAKSEYEDILDEPEAFLVDDPDYPVVVTAGRRMYPVEVPELEESSNWLKVISKPVPDADGFLTDYTMYRDLNDPEHYVFVFGDNELYSPDDGDWDWEAFSNEEATEWYNNYEGFTDEEDDADDDFEDSEDFN